MKKLTPEAEEEYLANSNVCPFCNGIDLALSTTWETDCDGSNTFAWRWVTCMDCGERWQEYYELIRIFTDADFKED